MREDAYQIIKEGVDKMLSNKERNTKIIINADADEYVFACLYRTAVCPDKDLLTLAFCVGEGAIQQSQVAKVVDIYAGSDNAIIHGIDELITKANDAIKSKSFIDLGTFTVDVRLQPDGKFDVYLAHEGSSGEHYTDVTAGQIGELVADDVECIAEGYQNFNTAV